MLQGLQDTPGARLVATDAVLLNQVRLSPLTLIDAACSAGLMLDDPQPAIHDWFATNTANLPAPMLAELSEWFEVMMHGSATSPVADRVTKPRFACTCAGPCAPSPNGVRKDIDRCASSRPATCEPSCHPTGTREPPWAPGCARSCPCSKPARCCSSTPSAASAVRVTSWLNHRARRWPNTADGHLFINIKNATRTDPVGRRWLGLTLGMPARVLREDRILHEIHTSGGDVRRICDLFGLTVSGALRYLTDVEPEAVSNPPQQHREAGA